MSNFVKVSNSHFQFWAELNLVLKWIITHTQCDQMARFLFNIDHLLIHSATGWLEYLFSI